MKLFALLLCIAVMVACSKAPIVGHVVIDDSGDPQVRFIGGSVGGCIFDNSPHEGDDVTISDQKSGTCHAQPHQDK